MCFIKKPKDPETPKPVPVKSDDIAARSAKVNARKERQERRGHQSNNKFGALANIQNTPVAVKTLLGD